MTIQEAINSEKPFRRPGYDFWFYVGVGGFRYCPPYDKANNIAHVMPQEILADDWEVKND